MQINNKTQKELIKLFRDMVSEGKQCHRQILLAYAFLRDKSYSALERKTNEDVLSLDWTLESRNTFLNTLANTTAEAIIVEAYKGQKYSFWVFISSANKNSKLTQEEIIISNEYDSLRDSVHEWMMHKYALEMAA